MGMAVEEGTGIRPWPVVVLSGLMAALLVFSAAALALPGKRSAIAGPPTPLKEPFTSFPIDFIAGYNWRHGALDPEIEEKVGSDASLKLEGYDRLGWAQLYTSYFGYATTPLEHEPDVCYPAQGYELPPGVLRTEIEVPGWSRKLPLSVFYFVKGRDRQLVINYYCINGEYFNDRTETKFLNPEPGGYYAQTRVTVSMAGGDVTADNFAGHPDYLRAVKIMQAAAPLLEKHFPEVRAGKKPAQQ